MAESENRGRPKLADWLCGWSDYVAGNRLDIPLLEGLSAEEKSLATREITLWAAKRGRDLGAKVAAMASKRSPLDFVEAAREAALRSSCQKSRRGVALWNRDGLVSIGWNHQPDPFRCRRSEACRESCNKLCVHAEAYALLQAGPLARGAQMLHVKISPEGTILAGGPPSCWQCSRLILGAKVSAMWLLEDGRGWVRYSAQDFHQTTLRNVGMG